MTPAPEPEYIITKSDFECLLKYASEWGLHTEPIKTRVYARPYTSASSDVLEDVLKKADVLFCPALINECPLEKLIKELRQHNTER